MVTPNEFWLNLHRLAESYHAEGMTPDERQRNILAQFKEMPSIAQRELLRDLASVMMHCPDLYPAVIAEANASESEPIRLAKQAAG